MDRRDWLEVAIRGYGVYLAVGAVCSASDALIEFVFGDLGFGATFRAILRCGVTGFLGLLAMTRAPDVLRFMGMRDASTPTPTEEQRP